MPLIIDTYNVLHVTGILPPEIAGVDTAGLIDLIRRSRYRRRRATLVCDGTPAEDAPTGRVGPVAIRYGGPGPTADALITAIIRRSSIPRRLTIVSSDRAVQREARRRRCGILSSEQFLQHLADDHEQAAALGAGGSRRSPAAGSGEGASASVPSASGRRASPLGTVLPPELIREAESIVEEGLPPEQTTTDADHAQPPAAATEESDAGEHGEPPHEPEDRSAPKRPREPVLPISLVREAEAMARREQSAGSEAASPAEPGIEEDHPEPIANAEEGHPALDDLDLQLLVGEEVEDLLPPEIIAEAESLLRDGEPEQEESEPGVDEEGPDRPRDA